MAASTGSPPAPPPLPTPPDFPVHWNNPEDEQLFWTLDRLHLPTPVTPLDGDLGIRMQFEGMGAVAAYGLPLSMRACRVNSYAYTAMLAPPAPPEAQVATGDVAQEKLTAAMGGLAHRWASEWLPEIQRDLSFWDAFDLRGALMAQLVAHLDETLARYRRLWEIHFLIVMPAHLAAGMFDDYYRDLFGDKDALAAYRLLQGFDNKVLETDRALWQLSRRALAQPEVRRVLDEQPAAEVVAQLERSSAGRAFLTEFRAFLADYGKRSNQPLASQPSWIEDPTPVIKNLQRYLTRPDRDLATEMAALVAERERQVAEARERLQGYPEPVVAQFEFLLKAGQGATILEEEHNFWIDDASVYQLRRVLLEFGRRFAGAGLIDQPADVFFLMVDELREMAAHPGDTDRHAVVVERKAEVEHFRTIIPPPAIGTPPPGPPPDSPVFRVLMKFFGGTPAPSTEPNLLRGNAGSAGTVRGLARVIRSLDEAQKLQPGEVLVAETTAPPWTPLFATAAAIVTDAGGVLSHGAVVAREYRIPAVVGTGIATTTIRDGQMLEVDGAAGTVRMIDGS